MFELTRHVATTDPGVRRTGLERQGLIVGSNRLGIPADLVQGIATPEPGLIETGPDGLRAVIGGESLVEPPEFEQDVAEAQPGVRQVWIEPERPVERTQRLVIALELAVQHAAIQMGFRISRIKRNGPFNAGKRRVMLLQRQQHGTALGNPGNMIGLLQQKPVEREKRLLQPVLLQQRAGGDIQQIGVAAVQLQSLPAHRACGFEVAELAQYRGVVLHEGDVGRLNRG